MTRLLVLALCSPLVLVGGVALVRAQDTHAKQSIRAQSVVAAFEFGAQDGDEMFVVERRSVSIITRSGRVEIEVPDFAVVERGRRRGMRIVEIGGSFTALDSNTTTSVDGVAVPFRVVSVTGRRDADGVIQLSINGLLGTAGNEVRALATYVTEATSAPGYRVASRADAESALWGWPVFAADARYAMAHGLDGVPVLVRSPPAGGCIRGETSSCQWLFALDTLNDTDDIRSACYSVNAYSGLVQEETGGACGD